MNRALKVKSPAQQLAAVRRAALNFTQLQQYAFGPRHFLASVAAMLVFVGLSFVMPLLGPLSGYALLSSVGGSLLAMLAACAGTFVLVMRKSNASLSWREELCRELCAYEPVDKEAFRAMQRRMAEEGRIAPGVVNEWLEVEACAVRRTEGSDQLLRELVNRKV